MALVGWLALPLPRRLGPLAVLTLLASGCGSRPIVANEIPLCERCHGGNGSAAPPRTPRGETDTSARGVGAHRRHLALQGDDVRAALQCETCHDPVAPTSVDAHLDGVVPVRFLDPAAAGGAGARWNPDTGRCENVYCHGATLRAGTRGSATAPAWTVVDGSQMTCASCHLAPPASHELYADRTSCHRCHPGTVKADGTIDLASGQHIDGTTPGATACDGCHLAPPDTGAHRAHANPADLASVSYGSLTIEVGTSPTGEPAYVFGCGYCHPLDVANHQDGTTEVDLVPAGSGIKLLNDPAAAFDPSASTCSGVYCHGATLGSGSRGEDTSPTWNGGQRTCTSCHAAPPASHAVYEAPADCQRCHSETLNPDGSIAFASHEHIDGSTPVPTACNACHLAPPNRGAHRAHANPADPASVSYGSLTVEVGLSPAGAPAYVLGCGYCHPLEQTSHRDGTTEIDLVPAGGGVKLLNDPAAAFEPSASTCSGVYCHGATLGAGYAGADTSPAWSGGQRTCASCHAAPPTSHAVYATPTECQRCHPDTVSPDGNIDLASGKHIDGTTTPVPTACNGCHLAPPETGAHRAHANPADPASASYGSLTVEVGLSPAGAPAYVFGCGYCHPLEQADHRDGTTEIDLVPAGGGLKLLNDPAAAWTQADSRCSGVYCHGATLRASTQGSTTAPIWTLVDGTQKTCASCHAAPPGSHAAYPGASVCQTCHAATVKPDGTIDVAGMKHVDGEVEAPTGGGCAGCHGAPPDTGAHRVHANPPDPAAVAYGGLTVLEDVSPTGGPSYDFGCGHCHPLDLARHALAAPAAQVDLAPPASPVPGDRIKARNDPAAAWDATTKTCTNVYCHSSGQETPAYAAVPAWTSAPGTLGCNGCHANPPRYASGGPGAADANSHVGLDSSYEWEFGHFAGMPGPNHGSRHGGGDPSTWGPGQRASPITCQTCHFDTVDPAKVRAGGFFYFDPGGDYVMPGGDPGRLTNSFWLSSQCATCHASELPGGRALPLRHVNGERDVVFDRRTALPDGYPTGLPALATTDPVRPYYMTSTSDLITFQLTTADCVNAPAPSCGVAADVVFRPPAVPGLPVLTLTLEHAQYDPATKTCSAVACHLDRQMQVETGLAPLRWGEEYLGFEVDTCSTCHGAPF